MNRGYPSAIVGAIIGRFPSTWINHTSTQELSLPRDGVPLATVGRSLFSGEKIGCQKHPTANDGTFSHAIYFTPSIFAAKDKNPPVRASTVNRCVIVV